MVFHMLRVILMEKLVKDFVNHHNLAAHCLNSSKRIRDYHSATASSFNRHESAIQPGLLCAHIGCR